MAASPATEIRNYTMNFGPHTTEADSFAIMDRALDEARAAGLLGEKILGS